MRVYGLREGTSVALLIQEIERVAAGKGLSLGRWQTNGKTNKWSTRITYAFYPLGTERPQYATNCDGPKAVLTQWEGETQACTAFRALTELLNELKLKGK